MEKMVTGKNIVKTFGVGKERTNVLDDVTIEISKGEFVAVMGPSGSGKSTLLFALSGADRIDGGCVELDGVALSKLNENQLADMRRTKMGFVFQQPTMLKNLNLLDNIILPALQGNRKNTSAITQKAKTLMAKTGIAELAKRDITEVSGGQLQRAGICRALMSDPKILFGDEPTGALNSKSAEEIMDIFSEINAQETAVMLVTHDANVAARTNRVLFMQDGRIVSKLAFDKEDQPDYTMRAEKIMKCMSRVGI